MKKNINYRYYTIAVFNMLFKAEFFEHEAKKRT